MTSKDAYKFLMNKFGIKCVKYTGFESLIEVLTHNNKPIKRGDCVKVYKKVADAFGVNWTSCERHIRYFKNRMGYENTTVCDFINTMIWEANNE